MTRDIKKIVHGLCFMSFTVNYNQPLTEAIKEGKYDEVNNNINSKNFPSTQKGRQEVKLVLVHSNKPVSSEETKLFGKQYGLRPANLFELLRLGAKYSGSQRHIVVGLGSIWFDSGYEFVPILCGSVDRRVLDLDCVMDDWNEDYRFVFVREQSL